MQTATLVQAMHKEWSRIDFDSVLSHMELFLKRSTTPFKPLFWVKCKGILVLVLLVLLFL